jgi:hypothetical protein
MTNRNGTTPAWFASNYPKSIAKDAYHSSRFEYGASRARWKQVYCSDGTTQTHTYIGKLLEKVVTGTTTDFRHFVHMHGQFDSI